MEVHDIVQETGIKTIPMEKKCKKAKWLSGEALQIAVKRREVKSKSEFSQSCPTFSDPMDCSLPGSSVHGIFQARVLEWGATAFSSGFPYFLPFKSEFGSKEFMI